MVKKFVIPFVMLFFWFLYLLFYSKKQPLSPETFKKKKKNIIQELSSKWFTHVWWAKEQPYHLRLSKSGSSESITHVVCLCKN